MITEVKQKILAVSNRFWGVDSGSAIKDTGYLFFGQLVGNIVSFAVMIVAARYVDKEVYGTYRSLLATVSIIGAFSLSGLSTAIIRSTAKGFDELFTESFKRQLVWSVGSFIATLMFALYHYTQGDFQIAFAIVVSAVAFPLINSALLYKSYLNGKKKYQLLATTNAVTAIVAGSALILVMILNANILTLTITYYFVNMVITLILYFFVIRKVPPNHTAEPTHTDLEFHLSAINVFDVLASQIDKVILFYFFGPVTVAVYTFATAMPEQLRNVVKFIPQIALPRIAKQTFEETRRKALPVILKMFIFTIPIAICYIVFAPLLFKLLFPTYQEAIFYSQIFALIIIFDNGIAGAILKAHTRIRELYVSNIVVIIAKLVLLIAGGLFLGVIGVIFSRIIARMISFFVSLYLTQKFLKL